MMLNYPLVTKIIEIVKENQDVKTIRFNHPENVEPGQFYMIWVPGVDEIPMSASYTDNLKGITFKKVGDATNKLFNYKKGDKIGIRGPYGTGFKIKSKKILFVAGGTGIATITPTVETAVSKGIQSTVVLGVKTKNELFFEKRLKKLDIELYIATDDGSKGYKGLATDLVEEILIDKQFDQVLTCGPEIMMKKLLELCKRTMVFQASLERYMKCGFGLCGQCCIGNGLRVCKEGPVFDGDTLLKINEFGLYKKDASGRKIKI